MKKIFLAASIVLCAYGAQAQEFSDLLLFSQYYSGGTARSQAMSGAFGALGGDQSSFSTNPAGIGIYRGSEFTVTPEVNIMMTKALLDGIKSSESAARLNLGNIGYVNTKTLGETGLKSISYGIAYNRLSSFAKSVYINSPATGSSMLDDFTDLANLGEWDDYYNVLAESTYAIWDTNGENVEGGYTNPYKDQGNVYGNPMKRKVDYVGDIGEYAFSLGGNVNDKFYWGATIGLQDIYYSESYTHNEQPNFEKDLSEFFFDQNFKIRGTGLNFKMGAIYRPIDMLRIGFAVHTPTFYWMNSDLYTYMEAYYNEPPLDNSSDDTFTAPQTEEILSNSFRINSPWRFSLSAAAILGTRGLIGVEAEYVNYSKATFRPNADFEDFNNVAADVMVRSVNVKAGAEIRVVGPLSLRAGVAYYGNPYDKSYYNDSEISRKGTLSISGGLGLRFTNWYLDMAYVNTKYPDSYYDMYLNPAENRWVSPIVQSTGHKAVFTLGFKF